MSFRASPHTLLLLNEHESFWTSDKCSLSLTKAFASPLQEEPAFSAPFLSEPDPDAGEPDETHDIDVIEGPEGYRELDDSDRQHNEPEVIRTAGLDARAALPDAHVIDSDALGDEVSALDDEVMDLDARTTFSDVGIVDPDAGAAAAAAASDDGRSVYDRQLREAALLEMHDLAVRSYASAFAAALAIFAVFSLAAFVGAHYAPPSAAGGAADVSGAAAAADDDVGDDVAGAGAAGGDDDVGPAEVTTPMFLRQGVRMEDPVVVTPVNAGAGSPFGRYQAFVRHMIGQVRRGCSNLYTFVDLFRITQD